MGSILGGGSSSSSSNAINDSASRVADTAQAGGQQNAATLQQLAGQVRDNINAGSALSANYQQSAKDYLTQQDALPSSLRTSALNSLGGLYGGSGSITDRAMASPLYQAAVQQGENSILRNASATGGLRSGNASDALATNNQNALIAAYNDQVNGLQGLASLPSNANNIAQYQAGIGNTLGQGQIAGAQNYAQYNLAATQATTDANNAAATALSQGQVAAAQNKAQSSQNSTNNLMGIAQLGLAAYGMSDRRLKKKIKYIGEENGIRKYSWVWNKLANAMGLYGSSHGVMADEVDEKYPDAVLTKDGYLMVDYQKLGVSHGV